MMRISEYNTLHVASNEPKQNQQIQQIVNCLPVQSQRV